MTTDVAPLELASALHVAGRLEEALPLYRQAIAAAPEVRVAHTNFVQLLHALRRWDELEAALRAALELWPDDAALMARLGGLVLATGRYEEGFQLYESRRLGPQAINIPPLGAPEWDGAPVGELLVWLEQGLGDTLQFARFVPLAARRARNTTFVCQQPLARLLAGAGLNVVGSRSGAAVPKPDAWALVGSLPRILGARLEGLPAPLAIASHSGGSGVGLVTRGNPKHINDARRSLPADLARELAARPGLVSLHPEDTGAQDLQATADIIADLKAVLSVDTAVAHLAASMGKPTFILLPWDNADWRWLRERTDSPWYPSARLYRQDGSRDWRPVVERALADLAALGALDGSEARD